MRRVLSLLALVVVLAPPAASRASGYDYEWALPEWRATWALPRLADNKGFAVEATADAVYVAGAAGSAGLGAGDLVLLKYDLNGSLLWVRNWGGFELDQAQAITSDAGGVWVAGSATTDAGVIQPALVRFSHGGDLMLAKTWPMGVAGVIQGVAAGPNGDVFAAGLTHPTRSNRDLFAMRVDPSATQVWSKTFDGGGWDEAWDVAWSNGNLYVAGYTSSSTESSQALLWRLDGDGSPLAESVFGGADNDEARALAVDGADLWVTGGRQSGRSTDVFVSRRDALTLAEEMLATTEGAVVGGGGYGIAVGQRGIYVAGGSYDFPAGGDSALLRFSYDGALEWTQVAGLPGFWDWNFDVDVRDGRFYTAGVLWQPGLEWYRIATAAYREDFPTASLTRVGRWVQDGETARARAAMDAFSPGDFLRWAEAMDASDPGRSSVEWDGASDGGRNYGYGWIDTSRDPMVGQQNMVESIAGLQSDFSNENYALVRNYTGVRGSLLDGLIRFRYYISHDRLIPQGGYLYVGETGIGLPPPPV